MTDEIFIELCKGIIENRIGNEHETYIMSFQKTDTQWVMMAKTIPYNNNYYEFIYHLEETPLGNGIYFNTYNEINNEWIEVTT